jgi:eukaryotic-like serine/threonine-protein kinase
VTFSAGTRLGPYELIAPVGAGGMGEVYRAKDTRPDRTPGAWYRMVLFA